MGARRGGDLPLLALDRRLGRLPVLETDDGGPGGEVLCSVWGGKDLASVKELATFVVEIVRVVLVREEDGVNDGELGKGESGVDRSLKGEARHKREFGASRAEDGIRDEDDVVDGDEGRSRSDVSDGNPGHCMRKD
jgi:hypothetical protein